MKRIILITEAILLFLFITLILCSVTFWQAYSVGIESYNFFLTCNEVAAETTLKNATKHLIFAIITSIATLANFAAIILIAIKDFPVFKPVVDKFTAHKEKCAQAKAERTAAKKQAKISELESQLEELKK